LLWVTSVIAALESIVMSNHKEDSCRHNRKAVQDTLDVIGGKWKILLLLTLGERPKRFKELSRDLEVSPRMLSRELQAMELNKLITRTALDTRPLGVEYAITEHGRSFQEVIESLKDWGLKHRSKLR
jgi:DNA-binding HxlR family transcriptional regulator